MIRRLIALAAVAAMLVLTGCSFSVATLPLPGGADVGKDPIEVTAMFPDALDLVPQSTVKLSDVTIGKVTTIELEDEMAKVTMLVRRDAELPANTVAEIRQTSLLGEKFVSLRVPDTSEAQLLSSGDTVQLASENRNPEVEEVLGALSLVLTGGGVAQLKTISSELNKALDGREDNVKSVLRQLETLMGELDGSKDDIVTAIESLNRLSITANDQMADITLALDKLPEALESLDSQRADLIRMLESLSELSDVGVRVIGASKDVTVEALTQLQPVLTELAKTGDDFANAFSVFLTYPFVDESVGRDPQVARNLHMGDYVNLAIKLDIHTDSLLTPVLGFPPGADPVAAVGDLVECIVSAGQNSPACQGVLDTPGNLLKIDELCEDPLYRNTIVCQAVGNLFGSASGASAPEAGPGAQSGPSGSNPVEDLLSQLDLGLLELPGLQLNRTAPGGPALQGTASVAELAEVYNPSLVYLLAPGVAR